MSSRLRTSRFMPLGFDEDRLCELLPHRRLDLRLEERARRARDHGERRPEIVRDRGEERVAELLGLDPELRSLRLLREARALERTGDLPGERLEVLAPLVIEAAAVSPPEPEHADARRRRLERDVRARRRRQGVRPGAGRPAVLARPLGDGELLLVEIERPRSAGSPAARGAPVSVDDEHTGAVAPKTSWTCLAPAAATSLVVFARASARLRE